jgi:[histone H3]-lysine4 N-trimethyltransferase ATXR3
MEPHVEEEVLSDLKAKIRAHYPSDSEDVEGAIQNSLLW